MIANWFSSARVSQPEHQGAAKRESGPRRFAVISDIHGNLPALKRCLDSLDEQGFDSIYCCGDIVGYGAHPNECCKLLRKRGISGILGNHDSVAIHLNDLEKFNATARAAILWTHNRLKSDHLEYLRSLPLVLADADKTLVHASPRNPERWDYILSPLDIWLNLDHFSTPLCFVGHSHLPMVVEDRGPAGAHPPTLSSSAVSQSVPSPDEGGPFLPPQPEGWETDAELVREIFGDVEEEELAGTDPATSCGAFNPDRFSTLEAGEVELIAGRRYLVNVGSVGQPRDSDPRLCYVTVDLDERRLSFHRLEYAVQEAQEAILEAGLPAALAQRLILGR
ncbi:MAG TPA: metallophosphoesterase family protein [Candidatus Sumerlaeota bacterium]|nr:metallophosphoesterase family protein [Candidatus Sumerlaeota bacterium]